MTTIIWVSLAVMFVLGMLLLVISMCRVAGKYDDDLDRYYKELETRMNEERWQERLRNDKG